MSDIPLDRLRDVLWPRISFPDSITFHPTDDAGAAVTKPIETATLDDIEFAGRDLDRLYRNAVYRTGALKRLHDLARDAKALGSDVAVERIDRTLPRPSLRFLRGGTPLERVRDRLSLASGNDLPAAISPGSGAADKAISEATVDDIAFAIKAESRKADELFRQVSSLERLRDLAREAGALGADIAVERIYRALTAGT